MLRNKNNIKLKLLLLLLASFTFSIAEANTKIDSLWAANASLQGEAKVAVLRHLAKQYDNTGKWDWRDSCIEMAFFEAELTMDAKQSIGVLTDYFEFPKLKDVDFTIKLLEEFSKLSSKLQKPSVFFLYYKSKYRLSVEANKIEEQKLNAERMTFYAAKSLDKNFIIEAQLANGEVLDNNNHKIEAFRTFADAIFKAKEANNKQQLIACYNRVSLFFERINQNEQAKEYKLKEYQLVAEKFGKNSKPFYYLLKDYVSICFRTNDKKEAEKLCDRIIQYARQTKDTELERQIFTIYRSYFISNENYAELKNLYTVKYPEAFVQLSQNDKATYARVRSYILENEGKLDSSFLMYQQAEPLFLAAQKDDNMLSNFYYRYGIISLKSNKQQLAISHFQQALNYAYKSKYIPFIIQNAEILDSLNKQNGDIVKAYGFSKIAVKFKDSLARLKNSDELLKIELSNAEREKKMEEEQHQLSITKKHNAEYLLIVVLILSSFIALILLASIKVNKLFFKMFGFVSFIFLFEFIILVSDNWIHHATHGSPLKVIMIKIVVISFLLPFHHWLEEKVIHYLIAHKLINTDKFSTFIKMKFMAIKQKIQKEASESIGE